MTAKECFRNTVLPEKKGSGKTDVPHKRRGFRKTSDGQKEVERERSAKRKTVAEKDPGGRSIPLLVQGKRKGSLKGRGCPT